MILLLDHESKLISKQLFCLGISLKNRGIMITIVLEFALTNLESVGEGNLDLTMIGNTYLLSKRLLLVLNNITEIMTLWLKIR